MSAVQVREVVEEVFSTASFARTSKVWEPSAEAGVVDRRGADRERIGVEAALEDRAALGVGDRERGRQGGDEAGRAGVDRRRGRGDGVHGPRARGDRGHVPGEVRGADVEGVRALGEARVVDRRGAARVRGAVDPALDDLGRGEGERGRGGGERSGRPGVDRRRRRRDRVDRPRARGGRRGVPRGVLRAHLERVRSLGEARAGRPARRRPRTGRRRACTRSRGRSRRSRTRTSPRSRRRGRSGPSRSSARPGRPCPPSTCGRPGRRRCRGRSRRAPGTCAGPA